MILKIAAFELNKRLSMMSTWIYFGVLAAASGFVIAGLGGAFDAIHIGAGAEKIHANAPSVLFTTESIVSQFGLIIVAGVFGQALHEDVEHRLGAILFSTPMRARDYLAGRFLGAFVTCAIIFAGVFVGPLVAAHLPAPITDRNCFGDDVIAAYFWPYLVGTLPNVLFAGALFFSLHALTRKMMAVYVAAVVLVVGYLGAASLLGSLQHETLAALLDPFGGGAVSVVTKYWTVAERNTTLVPLAGVVLENRALWLGIGAALLVVAGLRFRGDREEQRARAVDAPDELAAAPLVGPVAITPERGMARVVLGLAVRAFLETVKNTYFLVIVLAGTLFTAILAWQAGRIFDTPTWPITAQMIPATSSFEVFVLIVIVFSAGEIVWRERDARVAQILDALPVPAWAPWIAKALALAGVVVVLTLPVLVVGVVMQTLHGYTHYELGLYASELALRTFSDLPWVGLALFLQILINNKYLSHFVMVAVFVALIWIGSFRALPNVALFSNDPGYTYSDMNGYGHFLAPVLWFHTYWSALAVLLVVTAALFAVRGAETGRAARIAEARRRTRAMAVPLVVSAALFVALGGYLVLQTLVWHRFQTGRARETERADYEKLYKKTEHDPLPRITAITVAIDIDPPTRGLRAHGTYTVTNKTAAPIASVTIALGRDDARTIHTLALAGVPAALTDERFGLYSASLASPLLPGASAPLAFDLVWSRHGFSDEGEPHAVVDNGTFFDSSHLPSFGYDPDAELSEDNDRKKYDLAPKERLPAATAPGVRDHNYVSADADFVDLDITVSTTADQIALAPGTLARTWSEGERRFFHYTLKQPVLSLYSVLSARYQVRKSAWRGIPLEVYYDAKHPYNIDRMLEGMGDALTYASDHFGPYQHEELRIAEFPRYADYAQSFPGTIPFSESIGFIARFDPDDDNAVDYPYFVTAHETAHQWWAHQVIGARAQGETMLSETLAEYTALMVMKHKYGADHMRPFLAQEADGYLRGRAFEQKREVPLMKVEEQMYLHYNKGGHVMYALQDALGEDVVDAALAAFLAKWKDKGPPYPVAQDLVDELKARASPADQSLIADLIETITLYDSHAVKAECTKVDDSSSPLRPRQGHYSIAVDVVLKKLRAGELGDETEVPLDRPIEIGALDDKGNPLAIEERALSAGASTVTLVVAQRPAKVGVDPLVKLLDRKPGDNVVAVDCPK